MMIDSRDLTCNIANTIDTFEISWGSDVYVDMIQPVMLSMSCLGWTASYGVMQAVGQTVTITWQGWNLFTGTIRGINVQDEGNGVYIYNIDASSPWEAIGMKDLGGSGYPAQTDQARIDQLLTEAGAYSWDDIDPNVIWSTMTTDWYSQTWSTWATDIDRSIGFTTGTTTYDFVAYADGSQSALGLLDSTSADCRGRFYSPWSNGNLYWKSYQDIVTLLGSPAFTINAATDIIDGSLQASGSVADIYNVVNLTAPDETVTGVADSASIDLFGIRSLDIQTQLDAADRLGVATNILQTAAQIRSNLTGFQISTVNWDFTAGQNFLVYCISGSIGAATLTNIPSSFGGDQNVLITGGTMLYSQSDTIFDIKCQTANEVAAVQMWQNVDVSYTWATYLPNNIWSEAS